MMVFTMIRPNPLTNLDHGVKGGWVSGFGEERKVKDRGGTRGAEWREENPSDALLVRRGEENRRWNVERK